MNLGPNPPSRLTASKRLSIENKQPLSLTNLSTSSILSNIDDEANYLKKLEITEGNISSFLIHRKNLIQKENENKISQLETIKKEIDRENNNNIQLRNELIEKEKQFEELNREYKKCSELKNKYHNEIIKLRKENTKEFDNKVSMLNKQDKTLSALKKELFLLINILKLRVVNLDSVDEDESVKGYLLDIDKNALKYIESKKTEDEFIHCIKYWTSMKELLLGEDKENKNLENKENVNLNR